MIKEKDSIGDVGNSIYWSSHLANGRLRGPRSRSAALETGIYLRALPFYFHNLLLSVLSATR